MARRLGRFMTWVRSSTARQSSVSKAWPSSKSLASVLSPVRCTRRAYQVEPISTRGPMRSIFIKVVMPAMQPSASKTVKGSMEPAACSPSRRSISAAIPSGEGTAVYQSRQGSPSRTASTRPSWWSGDRGSNRTNRPVSVSGRSGSPGDLDMFHSPPARPAIERRRRRLNPARVPPDADKAGAHRDMEKHGQPRLRRQFLSG
jgi:hypothetical protein